jgi:putative addiction module killer protein
LPEIREYLDVHGRSRYGEWLGTLDAATKARIVVAVLRVERGSFSAAKPVGSGVSELRLDFGPGYRVYFGRDGEKFVILLAGGSKKRQRGDIELAHSLWAEYKRRKREE